MYLGTVGRMTFSMTCTHCVIIAKQQTHKMACTGSSVPAATARVQNAASRIPVPARKRKTAKDAVRIIMSRSGVSFNL